jgi:hypothetical protein
MSSLADRLFKEQQKLAYERAEKMVCPKCNSKMTRVGSLTLRLQDGSPKDGDYCVKCYRDFIHANVPAFIPQIELDKNHEMPILQAGKK